MRQEGFHKAADLDHEAIAHDPAREGDQTCVRCGLNITSDGHNHGYDGFDMEEG